MKSDTRRIQIAGRAVPVRGDDIDTDRIVPARYLRTVTFEGLGEHAFEDDRAQLTAQGKRHPFDDPAYAGATILLANKNFGCGSSREHAPQALVRWGEGIGAIIAESFAEIFHANCFSLGVPCVVVDGATCRRLMDRCESDPALRFVVDLEKSRLLVGDEVTGFDMPEGVRKRFVEGSWDSTTELLGNQDSIEQTRRRLPYMDGFAG